MLLARGFGGLGSGNILVQQGSPVFQLPSGAQTASQFTPPSTGLIRGDILYQTNQYKLLKSMQVARVRNELLAMFAAGQLQSCWAPELGVPKTWVASKNDLGFRTHLSKYGPGQICQFWGVDSTYAERNMTVPGEDLLTPIGVIGGYGLLGATVLPQELKLGNPTLPGELTIEKRYVPTDDQRWIAGRAIYVKSQLELARIYYGLDLSDRSNLDEVLADNTDEHGLPGLLTRTRTFSNVGTAVSINSSIRSFINAIKLPDGQPLFTTHLDNFAMNPIVPTPAELDGPRGMYNYYKRGGYLLSKDVAFGKVPVANTNLDFNLGTCMADQCSRTTSTHYNAQAPVAIQQYLAGLHGWITFVKITPTDYILRVQRKEGGTVGKVIGAITDFIMKLGSWLCQVAPFAASYNSTILNKETCAYPDGTLCAKGEKKGTLTCKCTPPTDGQIATASAATFAVQQVCGHFPPSSTVTPPVLPPMGTTGPDLLTIALIAGAVGGAIWLAKRK